MCCHPFHTVESVIDGNVFEALRRLMSRCEPRTALTRRAHLKAIISNAPAKRIDI